MQLLFFKFWHEINHEDWYGINKFVKTIVVEEQWWYYLIHCWRVDWSFYFCPGYLSESEHNNATGA